MAELNILYNNDIFDLANKIGYSIDNVYKLILENPYITSIDFDLNENPGRILSYDETFKNNRPQILFQKPALNENPIKQIRGKEAQSLFDIALMTTGIENLMLLAKNNNITNIDTSNLEGKLFNFNVSDVKDKGFYSMAFDITTGARPIPFYLLQENGDFLLQENGFKIILE